MGWSCKKAKRRCVLLIPCNDSVNAPSYQDIQLSWRSFISGKKTSPFPYTSLEKALEPLSLYSKLCGEHVFRHSYEKAHGITNATDLILIHSPITLNSHSKRDFLYYRL
jgi:hypothetical protein